MPVAGFFFSFKVSAEISIGYFWWQTSKQKLLKRNDIRRDQDRSAFNGLPCFVAFDVHAVCADVGLGSRSIIGPPFPKQSNKAIKSERGCAAHFNFTKDSSKISQHRCDHPLLSFRHASQKTNFAVAFGPRKTAISWPRRFETTASLRLKSLLNLIFLSKCDFDFCWWLRTNRCWHRWPHCRNIRTGYPPSWEKWRSSKCKKPWNSRSIENIDVRVFSFHVPLVQTKFFIRIKAILFLDVDCQPSVNWAQSLLLPVITNQDSIFCGRTFSMGKGTLGALAVCWKIILIIAVTQIFITIFLEHSMGEKCRHHHHHLHHLPCSTVVHATWAYRVLSSKAAFDFLSVFLHLRLKTLLFAFSQRINTKQTFDNAMHLFIMTIPHLREIIWVDICSLQKPSFLHFFSWLKHSSWILAIFYSHSSCAGSWTHFSWICLC